jgi:hypothetical protein
VEHGGPVMGNTQTAMACTKGIGMADQEALNHLVTN